MNDEDYRSYMTDHHVPLVRGLMVKHGIDKYSMVSEITVMIWARINSLGP